MKKLPNTLILTLILSACFSLLFSAKTHALYTDDNDVNWYTVPELLEHKTIVDKEEHIKCNSSQSCRKEYRAGKIATDEKYRALNILQSQQVIITAINFKTESVKLLLFDEDMHGRTVSYMPIRYGVELKHLIFVWVDNNAAANLFDNLKIYNLSKLFTEENPGIHVMLKFYGDDALAIEKDKEVEYKLLPGSNITKNRQGHYKFDTSANYFGKAGTIDYTKCLKSEKYPNGECSLVVSAEKGIDYIFVPTPEPETPEEPVTTEEPVTPEEPMTPKDPEIPEPTPTIISLAPELTPESNLTTPDPIAPLSATTKTTQATKITQTTTQPTAEIEIPKLGDTCRKERIIIFPWWIIILILIGNAAILWLFWPKKSKKMPKKY